MLFEDLLQFFTFFPGAPYRFMMTFFIFFHLQLCGKSSGNLVKRPQSILFSIVRNESKDLYYYN